jgi:F-box-like
MDSKTSKFMALIDQQRHIANIEQVSSTSPIWRLPPEILRYVFTLHSEDAPHCSVLLRVCSHWYNVAVDEPRLWCRIAIKTFDTHELGSWRGYPDRHTCTTEKTLLRVLSRAKTMPLQITVDLCIYRTSSFPPTILLQLTPDHLSRITHLYIIRLPRDLTAKGLASVFDGGLPLLETLHLPRDIPRLILSLSSHSPKLVNFSAFTLRLFNYRTATFWGRLTELTLQNLTASDGSSVSLCTMASPTLRRLTLEYADLSGHPISDSSALIYLSLVNSRADLTKCSWSSLMELIISNWDSREPVPPQNVEFPVLTIFRFRGPYLESVLGFQLPKLVTLDLRIRDTGHTSLQRLDIDALWPGLEDPRPPSCIWRPRSLLLEHWSESRSILEKALRQLGPYLEELELNTAAAANEQNLYQSFFISRHQTRSAVLCPRLKKLNVILRSKGGSQHEQWALFNLLVHVAKDRRDNGLPIPEFYCDVGGFVHGFRLDVNRGR